MTKKLVETTNGSVVSRINTDVDELEAEADPIIRTNKAQVVTDKPTERICRTNQ